MALDIRGWSASPARLAASNKDNQQYSQNVIFVLLGLLAVLVIYNVAMTSTRHLRTMKCMGKENQKYFALPQWPASFCKQHFIYAPLFRRQHSRPVRIIKFELGTLPLRPQLILFVGIIVMNVVLAVHGIEWNGDRTTLLMHLRNRLGYLTVTNIIPLVLMAGRNSPLILLTRLPFSTFNLAHRCLGNMVICFAVAHASVELSNMRLSAQSAHQSLTQMFTASLHERLIAAGFLAFMCIIGIFCVTITAFRRAFYETFLHLHIGLVATLIGALWYHLLDTPAHILVQIILAIWVIERSLRMVSLLWRNWGSSSTIALVETLPGNAMRVTLRVAHPWTVQPGEYIFLTIPAIGLWTNHPFSVAWSESYNHEPPLDLEKALPDSNHSKQKSGVHVPSPSAYISLLIRPRGKAGFTQRLFQKVSALGPSTHLGIGGRHSYTAFIDGPHGGGLRSSSSSLSSYGSVMLIAGGVGITAHVLQMRSLVQSYAEGTVAARRVLLVWIIRSSEQLEWIQPWMTSILAMPGRRDLLRIQLYVTQPQSQRQIMSPSTTVQMLPGKPDIDSLVHQESRNQVGAMAVSVSGPGSLADDVRMAVRRRQSRANIDFFEESFGW